MHGQGLPYGLRIGICTVHYNIMDIVASRMFSGTARFVANGEQLENGGVTQIRNEATATLLVNTSNVDSLDNRSLYCTNININFFYMFISSPSELFIHYNNEILHNANSVYKVLRIYVIWGERW